MLHCSRLTKSRILHHSWEFDFVFKDPDCRLSTGPVLLLARQNQLLFNRLGLVISKKNIPRAVDRNQLKRIIRESFRCQHLVKGFDIVVLARTRKSPVSLDNRTIFTALDKAWEKLKKYEPLTTPKETRS